MDGHNSFIFFSGLLNVCIGFLSAGFSLILEMNERIEYCSVCFQQMTLGGSEKFKLNERLSKCKVEKRC